MQELKSAFASGVLAYRIAILYGLLFSADSLLNAILLGFLNVNWSQLGTTSKFLLICAIAKNWVSSMLAYTSKTVAHVQKGGLPLPDTDQFVLQPAPVRTTPVPETKKEPQ